MSHLQFIDGVYLSSFVNLKDRYDLAFRLANNCLFMHNPEEISDPSKIRFALAWEPADDAFAAYPNLEMVASIGAGIDNILRCSSLPKNTIVTRVRDPDQAYEIAGFAVWQVVWYQRNMIQYFINQHNHRWHWVDRLLAREYTVGILGFGFMGQAIAKALVSLGFPVIAACRQRQNRTNNLGVTLLSGPGSIRLTAMRSNILINVLPLTTETQFVLDSSLFAVMPEASVLNQLGRGEHLVESDLMKALDNGQLSSATIDVFCCEPLPSEHRYWTDPRIMVTPHDASESNISVVALQVTNSLCELAEGKVPSLAINRNLGY